MAFSALHILIMRICIGAQSGLKKSKNACQLFPMYRDISKALFRILITSAVHSASFKSIVTDAGGSALSLRVSITVSSVLDVISYSIYASV